MAMRQPSQPPRMKVQVASCAVAGRQSEMELCTEAVGTDECHLWEDARPAQEEWLEKPVYLFQLFCQATVNRSI